MKKLIKNRLLIIKVGSNLLLLILLAIITFVGIYNPFDPFDLWKSLPTLVGSEGLENLNQLLYAIKEINFFYVTISLLTIFSTIFVIIICWDLNLKIERILFFMFTFILFYLLTILPSLFTLRLWSSDSAYHLLIVNHIIKDSNYKTINFQYGNFYYHKFLAFVSNKTQITAHNLFLFFPQLLMCIIYFLGLYLLLFSKKSYVSISTIKSGNYSRKVLFLIVLLHPFLLKAWSFSSPFTFILSFSPLFVYISSKVTEKWYFLCIMISIYIFLIQIHIYAYFFIVLAFVIIIAKIIYYYTLKKKIVLIGFLNIFPILISIIIFVFPVIVKKILAFILYFILFNNQNTLLGDDSIMFGGIMLNYYFKIYSLYSYGKILEILIYFGPVIYVTINNQVTYLKAYYKKQIPNYISYRIICDVSFPFIILSNFYSISSFNLNRISYFYIFFYYILFSLLFRDKLNRFMFFHKLSKSLFNIKLVKKIFQKDISFKLLLASFILYILIITPFIQNHPYSETQYAGIYWIKEKTPVESTILTSANNFNSLTEALSGRKSIGYCWLLFSNETIYNETELITLFISKYCNMSDLFLFLYFDKGQEFYMRGMDGLVYLPSILSHIRNSHFYKLVYQNTNSEIYKVVGY